MNTNTPYDVNVPFAIQLRENFGLCEEIVPVLEAERIENNIAKLKGHLIEMARQKKIEFSIFFRDSPRMYFGSGNYREKYPIPRYAFNMPSDMKKEVVKFLTAERFHFTEWHEHIAINLVKQPKV